MRISRGFGLEKVIRKSRVSYIALSPQPHLPGMRGNRITRDRGRGLSFLYTEHNPNWRDYQNSGLKGETAETQDKFAARKICQRQRFSFKIHGTHLVFAIILLCKLQCSVAQLTNSSQLLVLLVTKVTKVGHGWIAFERILQNAEDLQSNNNEE